MHKTFQDVAEFVYVYIKEAHPEDEWQMNSNLRDSVLFRQPTTFIERKQLARTFADKMNVETTTLVDDIENTANACYAAWPERIYIIDTDGRIAYKGGMGPFFFQPEDVANFLENYGKQTSKMNDSDARTDGTRS